MLQPKKTAALIIASMKPSNKQESASEEKAENNEYDMGLESSADDILTAISSKDVKLLVQALKDFHLLCDDMIEEEEQENESEGEGE